MTRQELDALELRWMESDHKVVTKEVALRLLRDHRSALDRLDELSEGAKPKRPKTAVEAFKRDADIRRFLSGV